MRGKEGRNDVQKRRGVVVEGRVWGGSTGVGVCGRVLQRLTCNPNNDDRPRGIHLPDWPHGDLGQVRVHVCVHHPDVTVLPAEQFLDSSHNAFKGTIQQSRFGHEM